VAKVFRFFKVMPTFRSRDGELADIKKNVETFDIACKVLENGGTIVMFPEAEHQHGRYLGTFKKGVPRICLGAEKFADFQLNLQILPVNLHYSNIHNFREKALIEIGKPFEISEILDTFKQNPNDGYMQFNAKARTVLKSMVLDIDDREHYEEYNLLREIIRRYRIKNNYKKYSYFDEFKEEKNVISEINTLKEKEHDKFEMLMQKTKNYAELLKKLNFRDGLVNKKTTGFGLIAKSLLMVLFFPFFIFRMINNGIPCYLANSLAKKVKDKVFTGSIQCAFGFAFFPVWYLIIIITASLISHSFIIGISYTILAFISLFIYFRYKVMFIKLKHLWRYFLQRKTEDVIQLNALKEEILRFSSTTFST
jgi:hypothetical protein